MEEKEAGEEVESKRIKIDKNVIIMFFVIILFALAIIKIDSPDFKSFSLNKITGFAVNTPSVSNNTVSEPLTEKNSDANKKKDFILDLSEGFDIVTCGYTYQDVKETFGQPNQTVYRYIDPLYDSKKIPLGITYVNGSVRVEYYFKDENLRSPHLERAYYSYDNVVIKKIDRCD